MKNKYYLWEYVEVKWRRKWWPAEITNTPSKEYQIVNYSVVYLGDFKLNRENNVKEERIRKYPAATPSIEQLQQLPANTKIRICWEEDEVFYLATTLTRMASRNGTADKITRVIYEDDNVIEDLDLLQIRLQMLPRTQKILESPLSRKRKLPSTTKKLSRKKKKITKLYDYSSIKMNEFGTVIYAEPTGNGVPWWPGIIVNPKSLVANGSRGKNIFKKKYLQWYQNVSENTFGYLIWYFGSQNFGFIDSTAIKTNIIRFEEGNTRFESGLNSLKSIHIRKMCKCCKKLPLKMLFLCPTCRKPLCELCVEKGSKRCSHSEKDTCREKWRPVQSFKTVVENNLQRSQFTEALKEAMFAMSIPIEQRTFANRRVSASNGTLVPFNVQQKEEEQVEDNQIKSTNATARKELRMEREEAKRLVCESCQSGLDDANMLFCDNKKCKTPGWHVGCLPRPLDDNFCLEKSNFLCPCCLNPNKNDIGKIVDFRRNTVLITQSYDILCLNAQGGEWKTIAANDFHSILKNISIQDLYRINSVHSRGGLEVKADDTPVQFKSVETITSSSSSSSLFVVSTPAPPPTTTTTTTTPVENSMSSSSTATTENSSPIKRDWRLLNGTRLGLVQYINLFSQDEVKEMQNNILEVMNKVQNLNDSTVDKCKKRKRMKIFCGYRYSYGSADYKSSEKKSQIYDDVVRCNYVPFIQEIVMSKLRTIDNSLPDHFAENQAVINCYLEEGSQLSVHIDDPYLFKRPIISIRLFSSSVLTFGCRGIGNELTPFSFGITQEPGTITIMEKGFAADTFKHAIRSNDIHGLSVSIIVREVTQDALDDLEKRKENENALIEDAINMFNESTF